MRLLIRKVLRYGAALAVALIAATGILFWASRMPSPQEEAARFRHVKKITLRMSGKNDVSLDSVEEIERIMTQMSLEFPANDCRCLYVRHLIFTTDTEEIEVILGPHDFWVAHWWRQIHAFGTPPGLLAAFDAFYEKAGERPAVKR